MQQRSAAVYANGGFERQENRISSETENSTTPHNSAPVVPEKLEQEITLEPSTQEDTNHIQSNTL